MRRNRHEDSELFDWRITEIFKKSLANPSRVAISHIPISNDFYNLDKALVEFFITEKVANESLQFIEQIDRDGTLNLATHYQSGALHRARLSELRLSKD